MRVSGFKSINSLIPYSASDVPKGKTSHGYVYGIADKLNPKIVKLGHTRNLKLRLRSLNSQTACAGTLVYAFYFECDSAHSHEQCLFRAFADFRVKPKKEWFHIPFMDACDWVSRYFGRVPDYKLKLR